MNIYEYIRKTWSCCFFVRRYHVVLPSCGPVPLGLRNWASPLGAIWGIWQPNETIMTIPIEDDSVLTWVSFGKLNHPKSTTFGRTHGLILSKIAKPNKNCQTLGLLARNCWFYHGTSQYGSFSKSSTWKWRKMEENGKTHPKLTGQAFRASSQVDEAAVQQWSTETDGTTVWGMAVESVD